MAQYIFTGRLELSGVEFYVTADSMEEAIEKARAGKYDEYNSDGAEAYESAINLKSGSLNE